MNEHERYFFDINGYLIVRNCLTKSQIGDLSDRLEKQRRQESKDVYGSDRTVGLSVSTEESNATSLLEGGGM